MNVLLILYKGDVNQAGTLKDRLNFISESVFDYEDMYFILTGLNSKEVYTRIATEPLEAETILVANFTNISSLGYWGRMPSRLWGWLSDCEEQTQDATIVRYKELIEALEENENELKEARSHIKEQEEANQILQRQITILKSKLSE